MFEGYAPPFQLQSLRSSNSLKVQMIRRSRLLDVELASTAHGGGLRRSAEVRFKFCEDGSPGGFMSWTALGSRSRGLRRSRYQSHQNPMRNLNPMTTPPLMPRVCDSHGFYPPMGNFRV